MALYFFSLLILFSSPLWGNSTTKEINPRGTYLYIDYFEDTQAEEATALFLKDMSLKENSQIELSFYSPTQDISQVLAVFSNSSGEFIPFKEDFTSPKSLSTQYSKITTDIPYDFGISSEKCTTVTVPKDSDRILFSLNDSFFSNNEGIQLNINANKVLFQIKEKTLYQVVDSPRWDLKEYSDSFDLVKNKTAILHLIYKKPLDSFSPQIFKPTLSINGKKQKTKCLDRLEKKEKHCDFSLSSFDKRGILEQVIILPMREKEALDKQGSFKLDFGFENQNCRSDLNGFSFNLNIHEVRKLQVGFTLIEGASLSLWESFVQKSLLDFDLLKRIYPVPDLGLNTPQWIILNERLNIDKTSRKVSSTVDNISKEKIIRLQEEDFNKTSGLLKDLVELKKMRIKQKLGKLFAVAGKDYFQKINKGNAAGFVVFTDSGASTENVGFVRLDQGGTGTILHELGHLLGQHSEFYQKNFQNLSKNDVCQFEEQVDYCFRFKDFKGFYGSLRENYEDWDFVVREKSIMDNDSQLYNQWIDRDTYGKILKTLSDPDQDPEILIFSGVFNKKAFINPELEYVAEAYLTASHPEGDLKIKILDTKSKELYSVKISTKVSIEFIDSLNKLSTTENLTPTPVVVALPYLKTAKSLTIVEEKTGQVIYSQNLEKQNIIITSKKPNLSDRRVFE